MARDRLAIASRIITTPPLIQFLTVTLTLPLRRAMPAGSKELIGDPKQPTITIYSLSDEGEYRGKQFRGDDRIESPTFPDLNLTVEQIFSVRY